PYVTDNDGYILDCEFGPTISNPGKIENMISNLEGVVEVGLFVGICDAVFMASSSGVEIIVNPEGRLS
ncbi:MAG: ribose-5-phosphate isomerase A, partial [Candidatus Thalassarchaeaceae archaeon]|nr:ribose-5-phosphate isomerase A [Candidatus Thalassarchaeaceae archaeon]